MKAFLKIFPFKWLVAQMVANAIVVVGWLGNPDFNNFLKSELGFWRYLLFPILILIIAILLRILPRLVFQGVKIDSDRKTHEQNLVSIIKNCKKRFWTVSIAGRSFTKSENNMKLFSPLIDNGVDMKVMGCAPSTQFILNRENSEDGYISDRIINRCKGSLTRWQTFSNTLEENNKHKFELKIHENGELNQSILIVDDMIYIVPYLYGTLGEDSPVIKLNKNLHTKVFNKFENVFMKLWKQGVPPSKFDFHEIREEPKYGHKIEIKSIVLYAPFENNRLMLIERNNEPRKGYYSFVGGHCYMDELLIDALRREVREEITCEVYKEEHEIIIAEGKDNTDTNDEFFFDAFDFKATNIKGMSISRKKIKSGDIATSNNNVTNYNLFKGSLNEKPTISEEVKSIRWETLEEWVRLIDNRSVKIQPVDYLLLKILADE